ncbi:hypothetical protein JIN85_19675 [Luteolibacter pohnpeiensis]|uniref:Uncharacterized protein n=1 Tax=Luteolibacter pohnpeiensis TaxID=454153 RepID=A0A934VXR3_9BACT|nr:hypothetical protein [Luteolibacter pohnpeiensis]MBK1884645.1 hypothetical protein [Luteolibacter pohnpeiensis]
MALYVLQEMKILAIVMLSVISADSQQVVADNQDDDWLPIPDGYVWPKPAEKAPDFRPVQKKFSELGKIHRTAIKDNWPDEVIPEQVYIATMDLNGDGRLEIFVEVPILGGSGGAYYEILSTKDGKAYNSVGGFQGGVRFLIPKNGWLQIQGSSRGGGGHFTRYLMTFLKDEYEVTRNEDHDTNTRKVTIRKTEAGQAGAGQPATAPESKPEGDANPKPESAPAPR